MLASIMAIPHIEAEMRRLNLVKLLNLRLYAWQA